MARRKGMGSLQREKNGCWTLRVGIGGKRYSRTTGTSNREQAERFAQRFLAPFGLGEKRLPLSEVWFEYERSPKRRDLAPTTLHAKRLVWMHFARWMERGHPEVAELGQLTADMVGEYLRCLRTGHGATTYNNRVCVLREICRTLYDKAEMLEDPWADVRLLADDAHARREFSVDELERVLAAARKAAAGAADVRDAPCRPSAANEWALLFLVGVYTGLRLGDCCTLEWKCVNLERRIIQVIPNKTRRHAHGRPVTIPIHPVLFAALCANRQPPGEPYVLPQMAAWYRRAKWRVSEGLKRIFKAANIVTSVRIEGRRNRAPEATFHSLRHTFVSLAANAGVPLPVVQSIVGHTSTAMTRHYYHETEAELWRAVRALPAIGIGGRTGPERADALAAAERDCGGPGVAGRLSKLDGLLVVGAITRREYRNARTRILGEV